MKRLEAALTETANAVNQLLDRLLPPVSTAERRVVEAMRYSVMGGGKRIRPFLVRHSAKLFDVADANALRVAAAIEMLHCYSLVHDDLPAMDDADLRRGRPSVHRQFDEATAILAGDGLLTMAFEVLADPATHANPLVRADMTFFETPAGGAVFSASSISWSAALPCQGFDNNVARITGNVLRRFLDPEPFIPERSR